MALADLDPLNCRLDTVRARLVPTDAEIRAAQQVVDRLSQRIKDSVVVGKCWDTFYIFACCGLVLEIFTWLLNISLFFQKCLLPNVNQEDCIRPEKVYVGGSFKKRTCLACNFDVDMVVFLLEVNDSKIEQCKASLKRALGSGDQLVKVGVHILKLRCAMDFSGRNFLPVDVSFTGSAACGKAGAQENILDICKTQTLDLSAKLACSRRAPGTPKSS